MKMRPAIGRRRRNCWAASQTTICSNGRMSAAETDVRAPGAKSGIGSGVLLLVIAYIGFVSLGLPDAVTGVAWPTIREWFRLPQVAFSSISVALGTGYFLSSFFAGQLTQRLGIGLLLTLSSLLVALAMFGNASAPWFAVFLACI